MLVFKTEFVIQNVLYSVAAVIDVNGLGRFTIISIFLFMANRRCYKPVSGELKSQVFTLFKAWCVSEHGNQFINIASFLSPSQVGLLTLC